MTRKLETEIINKLAELTGQLDEMDQSKRSINYNDFAHGYQAALKWVLSNET
jgi:hypothetical protein